MTARLLIGDAYEAPVGICPHCGDEVRVVNSRTVTHSWPPFTRQVCPGSNRIAHTTATWQTNR